MLWLALVNGELMRTNTKITMSSSVQELMWKFAKFTKFS